MSKATSSSSSSSSSGIGFFGLLFIALLVLKLVGVIDWSWWWVTVPLWGGFAFIGAIFLIGLLVILIKESLKKK